jgi:uroporphyrinogen-III synthase
VLQTSHPLERIKTALAQVSLVARGPKPIAVLKQLGLTPEIAVPEPNTWRDILRALDARKNVAGLRIAVQEYGVSNAELLEGLKERGAVVSRVPVYRWALPEDTALLRRVLDEILAGNVDVVLITNAVQVEHVMKLLEQNRRAEEFRQALRRMVVASIGEIASERLRSYSLPVDLEPSHPKMGILVKETSEQANAVLQRKRSSRA